MTRAALVMSGVLTLAVLGNLFFLQAERPRVALATPASNDRTAETGAARQISRSQNSTNADAFLIASHDNANTQAPFGAPTATQSIGYPTSANATLPNLPSKNPTAAARNAAKSSITVSSLTASSPAARSSVASQNSLAASRQKLANAAAASPTLVRAIQRELYTKGYLSHPPDGALATTTRAAILNWEQDNSLPTTADASDTVLKTLLLGADTVKGANNATPSSPIAQSLVQHVQMLLNARHKIQVSPTGTLDDATTAAITKFERSQGLPVSGKISSRLVARLENAGRHGR